MGSCVQREWDRGEVGNMGTSGNRDSHLASRSVLNNVADDALTISNLNAFRERDCPKKHPGWKVSRIYFLE